LDSVGIQVLLLVDNNPPHSLVVVVVGVMEVRYDFSRVSKGRVHKDRYLHSLVNNRDNFVGHVVVFIFERIVHMRVVDKLWLMDIRSAQVQCDNYGWVGHPHERCFDLYP
jgi:hypothetical protein